MSLRGQGPRIRRAFEGFQAHHSACLRRLRVRAQRIRRVSELSGVEASNKHSSLPTPPNALTPILPRLSSGSESNPSRVTRHPSPEPIGKFVAMPSPSLPELLATVAYEADTSQALEALNRAALELTHGRNSMVAVMNDELGCLELAQGVGREWEDSKNEGMLLSVSTREGIVGYVAATGEIFRSGNVKKEPRYRNLFDSTVSEIAAPVRDRFGRIRAVLNVESDREDAFSDEAEETCRTIALLIAIELEKQEAHTREQALLEVSNAFDKAWSEQELIDGVLRVAGDVLRFQAFSLFLLDPRTDKFVLRGSVGHLHDQVGQIRYSAGEGCTGWVAETGQPILLENPSADPRWRGRHVEFPSDQIASFLAVPVVSRGQTIGVLRAIRRVTENEFLDNRFTETDQTILTAIGDHLATALQTIRTVQKMVHSERMVAWGELSAKSSHMIGNRMFALKGDVNELAYQLEQEPLDPKALEEVHGQLAVGVTRIEEILQDFRDFLTATQVHKEAADLNEFVAETVHEMFPHRTSVELKLELDPNLPAVDIDRRRLRRALSELIENALGYVEAGAIHVATGVASKDEIRSAGLATERSYATIVVADSGPGVQSDQKSHIFQPFFSNRAKGMGLGLSIVKGIVDAHEGGIFEGGEPGHGAKFVILLPTAERSKTGKQ